MSAIFGSVGRENGWAEVADLEKPQVMERRAALRSRPDIRELIEAGAKEVAAVNFGGRYVAAAFQSWKPGTVRRRGVSPTALSDTRDLGGRDLQRDGAPP